MPLSLPHYMHWAKSRPPAAIDLALSNVRECTLDDLPGAREALALDGRNDDGYPPLLEAIAARYGVPADRVATATGTSGANFLVCLALLEPGDDVLVECPAYDPLLAAARTAGARLHRFERRAADRFALDPDRVAAALTPATRLVVITNPHNPSGAWSDDDALARVVEAAGRQGAWVLVDEVYLDAARGCGARPAALAGENVISTSSLTKSYGLAALRCGWAIAAPHAAERIRRARDLVDGNGSILAERLSVIAFEHLEALAARARALVEPNVRAIEKWLLDNPHVEGAIFHGTVAFPRLRHGADASEFCDRLFRERGVAVVPGRFFEAPAHFRVGLGVSPGILPAGLAAVSAALER